MNLCPTYSQNLHRYAKSAFFLLLIFIIAAVGWSAQVIANPCENKQDEAVLHAQKYDYEKALQLLEPIIQECKHVGIAYDAAQYANQLGRYEDAIIFVKKYALRWSQDNAEKLRLQNMLKRYEDSMIKDGQRILKQPRTVHQNADKGLVGSRSGRGGFILKGPALENRLKIEKRACVRQIKTRDIFPTYHSASKPLNRNILFKYRQHNLEPEMIQLMEVMVKTLKPLITEGSCVLVVGHTDQSGGENYNLRLSERRAQTVVNYLLKQGLPKHAIQSAGMGKLQPLNPNHDAYAYRQNRRVEFTLLK